MGKMRLTIMEEVGGGAFCLRTEPKKGTVFFKGREMRMVDLIFDRRISVDEIDIYPEDEPDYAWPVAYLHITVGEPWVLDLLRLYKGHEYIDLQIETGGSRKWHLEGEKIRKLEVSLVNGRPVLSLVERRLEPLAVAA
ncbi:MAG: hypothetical protein V4444_04635 [Pseudomonadota bacterium]